MGTELEPLGHLRLLQLLSPMLPVGGFSYSQGLESAVEAGWVTDEAGFRQWLVEWIDGVMAKQELPLLIRLYEACQKEDLESIASWSQFALAARDTQELRQEELARANAYNRVLKSLWNDEVGLPSELLKQTPLASIAWAGAAWNIPLESLLLSYSHSWLETSVTSGVKIIPLGQSTGQRLLHELSPLLITAINKSHTVADRDIGFSMPSVSAISAMHEVQYSRVYRS